MMLGMAASSSMAVPTGRFSQGGASSVMNRAMPKLTGTAIRMAISEETRVPTVGERPPNSSSTGSHCAEARKFQKPNFSRAGRAPR